jgi:thiamine biosynthesis protein ThiI
MPALSEQLVAAQTQRLRLLVRLAGEIGTKSRPTRRRFLQVLAENARRALDAAGVVGRVHPQLSRLLVDADDPRLGGSALARVFGVHAVDEVREVPFTSLSDLVEKLVPFFREHVAGRSFAVRARRRGVHSFSSPDVAAALGAALRPFALRVDLDAPEAEVRVEVDGVRAYAVLDRIPGPDGLPLGTGGRAVVLFSGGFDSPVAAWSVMRRGVEVELLHFDLGGCGQVEQAMAVARALLPWAAGHEPRVHVVDFGPLVTALCQRVESRLRQILLRRAMYRAATILVRSLGAEAIVTGESLGQVSTQTLRNLAICEESAGVPVLRPLVGMNKEEIIQRARLIGTHDASSRVQEHCAIAPGPVVTWAAPEDVACAERGLAEGVDDAWLRSAVEARRVVDLREGSVTERPGHVVDRVPAGALVVDVREPHEGEAVGDLRLPFSRALEEVACLDPARTYVLVCSSGVRSGLLAQELQRRGYRAFSLAGGIACLRGPAA